eukprot:TRINITY_DN17547_c6_g1_i1.p1 TRINITY_DN17547_c6_g1~~TRINITY_DN17547_c6_g1_i1.p1  ORF type:complete len:423 (-),score=111.45 TRINITY_DN17547_c6_g1_i1:400-1668(-)
MSHQRAIYAARFLRPPGFTKRLILREKPRELTGPYENPVRRWVRLREKAREFSELPPPRKVPVPKPSRRTFLQAVEGVPKVSPEALQRRLDFLLSPLAAEQQLAEPLPPGMAPIRAEMRCWERQMRDLRRVYRAQYLQKLAEVTEIERQREAELNEKLVKERKQRKQAHLQRVGEDMKRRAILMDRKRIESKVSEAMQMARRSKLKRQQLYWFRRMENLSKLIVSAENVDEAFAARGGEAAASSASSGVLLSRNVSVPFLLRQLGGAKGFPKQRSHRMPHVENVAREVLESSYEFLPEDEPRFAPAPEGPTARDRAAQLYSGFTSNEKMLLLKQKIEMLNTHIKEVEEKGGKPDHVTVKLLDELEATKYAAEEAASQDQLRATARSARGADPPGLEPAFDENDDFDLGGSSRSGRGRGGSRS